MKSQSILAPFSLLLFFVVLHSEHFSFVLLRHRWTIATKAEDAPAKESCDLFSGQWIYDEAYPLYQEEECPYIQPQLTCQGHGRPDNGYQHWRWQPRGCSLPTFNASLALEKLIGKRLLFVGDSLNRGQFTSMVCLLHRAIPAAAKSLETVDSLTIFRAKEYNATVEFYWAPFLMESNSDNAIVHRVTDRIVRVDNLQKHGRHWLGADVIIFNTYLWWMTGVPMKILQGSFTDEEKKISVVETDEAYRMGLRSLVRWVENNMDLRKNRVFFSTMSPLHERGSEWGGAEDENCYNQTAPIENATYWGSGSNKIMMRVLREELVEKSRFPITLLNITQLSEYRKDAHTQIYKQQWSPPTLEQLANPKSYADCVHWCLPGLQDTWNELLYTKLFIPDVET